MLLKLICLVVMHVWFLCCLIETLTPFNKASAEVSTSVNKLSAGQNSLESSPWISSFKFSEQISMR